MTVSSAVLDASFAIRLLPINPSRDTFWRIVDRFALDGIGLIAPWLCAYETTSGIAKLVRFADVTPGDAPILLRRLARINIQFVAPDFDQIQAAMDWTIRLRRAAAYDSFYLALAESMGCDLWTADRRLFNTVNLPWVRFVGENGEESREPATRSPDG
jgi:predicted nucleic acid-binding protein